MAAIDLTSVALVREWMPSTPPTQTTQLNLQTSILQAAITAVSLDFLRRTGRGPQSGQVPTQSPLVQPVQFSEVYDGSGTNRMFLRNAPIVSVSSLTIFGQTIQQSVNGSPGWVIDGSGKSVSLVNSCSFGRAFVPAFGASVLGVFPRGSQNVAITYTAGFSTQTVTNELQTIPSAAPYTVSPEGNWLSDGGVKYFSNGNPFAPVQTAPAQGQYYLNGSSYLFNAADAGQQIQLSYTAAGTPPDLELACRRVVYQTYVRRGWEGLSSLSKPEEGQTNYTKWEMPPEVQTVLKNYTRTAIV